MKHNYFYPYWTINSRQAKKLIYSLSILLVGVFGYSQEQTIEQIPYLETAATIDSLVTPNQFYLNIQLSEILTRGRISMKDIESSMKIKLQSLGIKTEEQLTLISTTSRYKAFFPRRGKSYKLKTYSLLVSTNKMVNKVIKALKITGIYNVHLKEVYHSNANQIQLLLRKKAITMAREQALLTLNPLKQKIVKAIGITDSNLENAKLLQSQKAVNTNYRYYTYGNNINLGLKLNKIPIKTTVYVKFEIE